MISLRAVAVAAILTVGNNSSSAVAASFDGYWSLLARTTNGHCGVTRWDVAINGGRFYYPGGFFMGYPVGLGGTVSPAGHVRVTVAAGPRIANGAGRLADVRGSGKWAGQGPSGTCSGIWTAARVTASAPSWGGFPAPMTVWPVPYR